MNHHEIIHEIPMNHSQSPQHGIQIHEITMKHSNFPWWQQVLAEISRILAVPAGASSRWAQQVLRLEGRDGGAGGGIQGI